MKNGQRTTDYGQRTPVEGHFVLQADNRVGFEVPFYDHNKPLVIDPVLLYSTYLGGSGGVSNSVPLGDVATGIAVDSAGNAYVTGYTPSPNFPTLNAMFPLRCNLRKKSKGWRRGGCANLSHFALFHKRECFQQGRRDWLQATERGFFPSAREPSALYGKRRQAGLHLASQVRHDPQDPLNEH